MKLAPNLETFFTDLPYPERIARIADLGFKGADVFGPENKNAKEVGRACEKYGVTITMLVGSDLQKGYNDPALHDELARRMEKTAAAANEMHACNVVVLTGNTRPKVPASAQSRAVIDGLKKVAPIADKYNVTILLEMLNSLYDHPGYYLDNTELMAGIIRAVDHPRVKGLYDMYHAGIMRGNIIEDIRAGLDAIGHFHMAGIPGRHEPKDGEQNYPFICRAIDKMGYAGFIGLEYWPLKPPAESLKETLAWLGA